MKSSLFYLLELKITFWGIFSILLLYLIFVIQVITALALSIKDLVKKKKIETGMLIYWGLAIFTLFGFINNDGDDRYNSFWLILLALVVIYFFGYLVYRKKQKKITDPHEQSF
jgi:phosphatidylserine synthase